MLFKRSDLTEESALKARNGLRAFATLFKLDSSAKPEYKGDGLFTKQVTKMKYWSSSGQTTKQDAVFDIYFFWEKIMKSHVTYDGSLTKPGCNENVGMAWVG